MITVDMLRKHNACKKQVATFERHWPNGIKIILPSIRKAIRLELSPGWPIAFLIGDNAYDEWNKKDWEIVDGPLLGEECINERAKLFIEIWKAHR